MEQRKFVVPEVVVGKNVMELIGRYLGHFGSRKTMIVNDKNIIKNAIEKAFYDEDYRKFVKNLINPYGDGYAHKKIVSFLDEINLNDEKWYTKRKLI